MEIKMLSVIINSHEHYWDCETCGGAGSTTISFESSELGFYMDGEPSTCFQGSDGYIQNVLKELNQRLTQKGIIVELKENNDDLEFEVELMLQTVDWDNTRIESEQREIYEQYCKLSLEYEEFYKNENLALHYAKHGVELIFEHTCDEPWEHSYDDYDADEHDEYYSELFDEGYTTDESYKDDE